MKTEATILLTAFAVWACAGLAAADPNFTPHPGTQHLRYEGAERAPGQPDRKYRMDFDLVVGRDRGIVAIVRHAASAEGDAWNDAVIDPACAAALHAHPGELARVTLWPIAPAAAAAMNEDFMAMCAPAALFFPMTDILNVVLVQVSPEFKLGSLNAVGDSVRTSAYATRFERLGVAISVGAPGGETRLTAFDTRTATVDWVSDPMQLQIIHRATSSEPEVTLTGAEHFGFRIVINARTGALEGAATTADTLDLLVSEPGLPPDQAPRLAITREVSIVRTPVPDATRSPAAQ